MRIRSRFLISFLGSLFVIILALMAIFAVVFYAITGEAPVPTTLYKTATEQKAITFAEQEALITLRNTAKDDPAKLLTTNTKKQITDYEKKGVKIVIRRGNSILYHSDGLVVKSLLVHAPKFDTDNIYTQGTIDNKGNLFRYLKFDFYFPDQEKGSVMILNQENSFSEFMQKWGIILISAILLLAILLLVLFNRSLNRSVIRPLRELNAKVSAMRGGDLNEPLIISSHAKGEVDDLANEFESLRSALHEANKEKEKYEENRKELITSISHDLKTPITSIIGYVEGLKDGVAKTAERQNQYLGIIHSQAKHVDHLIDELFIFSKLDMHKLPFQFESIPIYDFLTHFVDEYTIELAQKNIKLVSDFKDEHIFVRADRMQLRRVLDNLVQNSTRYMDKTNKEIRLSLRSGDSEVIISVQDNGVGMSKAEVAKIFDRFYRVEKSRNQMTGGSGLGLAITKEIIAEHGGEIWAESAVGAGTTMFFTLKKGERNQ
ncbi:MULTISPECIES: cell wall metabolism sensor histidine kinase WalK [Listeria]|uniref:sensor histidine kinase n=1 Tax=Listeria TaxID=1637 RepID=UPI000B5961BF|nr:MULTISPECIES: HAMP domain-containing sensor histidine kinase [Listeria]